MCGIVGVLNASAAQPVDPDLLGRMVESVRHRGPDDSGVWREGSVGLGSSRLAVIDLSPKGRQPMSNEDGSLVIVFNGEIYNFRSLRADLEARGHRFTSNTDTEIILHAYEEHGDECLRLFRGMFAFAIWDRRNRSLFAARDRLGKKPFYYRASAGGFSFASEAKALLQDPAIEASADRFAIDAFMSLGYVPGSCSAFAGISRLPPAHWLKLEDGRLTIERYWALRYESKLRVSEPDACAEAERLLSDAVRLRMIGDVPLGAHLSGGIDSSLVVAMMAEQSSRPVRTFSIGFEDPVYDELPYADQVSALFGTEHHAFVVKPDVAAVLPRMVWHYDEPFADSSALPSFYLCEMTRASVTVALNGDGGDESFIGYDRYRAAALAEQWAALPAPARAGLAASARRFRQGPQKSAGERLRRFTAALDLPPASRYASWITVFDAADKRAIYTEAFRASVAGADPQRAIVRAFESCASSSAAERAACADAATYLPDDLLVKADIAGMAHALEVRSPFLDHLVVEFAAALPVELKLRGRVQKYLLKQLMRRNFPGALLERPKAGFAVPIDRWFRRELYTMAADLLLDATARQREYFKPAAVERLLSEHRRGVARHHTKLWTLLMLELWHRAFIDRRCRMAA